jgi:DNA-binding transcriptional LysR family regulator
MEHECGFTLFLRERGRLSPTPEANMLYAEVQRVFVGIDKIEQAASDIRLLKRGQLSVAAMPALALRYLPGIIADFSRTHPNVRIVLQSHTSRSVADHVADQQVDIGLGALCVENPGIRHGHLCRTPAVCVLPVGHRLAQRDVVHISDLRNEAFISLASEDHLRNTIDRAFEEAGVMRNIAIETHVGAMACVFVANGVGITVVDPFSASQFRSDEVCTRPLEPAIPFDIWILYPTARKLSQVALAFLDSFRSAVRALDLARLP